jgi:hypothetical protein
MLTFISINIFYIYNNILKNNLLKFVMQLNKDSYGLDKKPTWYIFLLANVIVLVSCLVTWGMLFKGFFNSLKWPTLACNLTAIGLITIFLLIEYRITIPKIVHFQKKWLWWYLIAIIIFLFSIIFNFVFYYFVIQNSNLQVLKNNRANWKFLCHVIIIGLLTLSSIAIQRYARFRIDLDLYRRVHGQNPSTNKKEKISNNKSKPQTQKKDKTANTSSGLLKEMDKN